MAGLGALLMHAVGAGLGKTADVIKEGLMMNK